MNMALFLPFQINNEAMVLAGPSWEIREQVEWVKIIYKYMYDVPIQIKHGRFVSCVAEVLMILAILLFLIPIIIDEPLLYLIPAPFVPCIFLVLIPPAERAKMNRELGCGQTRGSFIENIKFYLLSTVGLIVVVGVSALCFGGPLALLLYLID